MIEFEMREPTKIVCTVPCAIAPVHCVRPDTDFWGGIERWPWGECQSFLLELVGRKGGTVFGLHGRVGRQRHDRKTRGVWQTKSNR
jgi:hypothetical protein